MNRRDFIKASLAVCGTMILAGCKSETITADSQPEVLPSLDFSDELTELLAFLQPRTKMLCLGDTNHKESAAQTYLFDVKNVRALRKIGYENVFLEDTGEVEDCYTKAKDRRHDFEKIAQECKTMVFRNDYLSHRDREIISHRLLKAIHEGNALEFFPVDQRSYEILGALYRTITFDEVGEKDEPKTFMRIKNLIAKSKDPSASNICQFGLGHFVKRKKYESLYRLFRKDGLEPCTVAVYASESTWKDLHSEEYKKIAVDVPDVEFLIHRKAGQRIVFNNHELGRAFSEWKASGAPRPARTQSKHIIADGHIPR